MNQLVIGIPTYKRPSMLKKLILSIYSMEVRKDLISFINIVIVDNDAEKTAELIVPSLKSECRDDMAIHYFNYPKKGLTHVRNEILNKAQSFNPDYIALVDDDEYVSPNWLNELMVTMLNNNADMVQGPNVPVFEKEIPPYLKYWFDTVDFENNTRVTFVETNNLLVKSKFIHDNGLSFDSRFDQTGGEDTFFGVQALNKGASVFWAKKAIVYETIPPKRATLKWLIKRKYRGATTFTYILKLEKDYQGLIKKSMVNILYFGIGLLTLPALLFTFKHRYWGLFKICEAFGGFAGLFNIRYKEYATTK